MILMYQKRENMENWYPTDAELLHFLIPSY